MHTHTHTHHKLLEPTVSYTNFRLKGRTLVLISCLPPCYSKCGPETSSTGVLWELVRGADAQVPARPPERTIYILAASPKTHMCGTV